MPFQTVSAIQNVGQIKATISDIKIQNDHYIICLFIYQLVHLFIFDEDIASAETRTDTHRHRHRIQT